MKVKNSMLLILMGIGGTLLYQQIKNGNVKKCIMDMEEFTKKTCDDMCEDLEDMM